MAWDIVKKISQMVAKAESTDSLAEAESIMMKVREMLDKHGVTLLSLSELEARSADPVGTSRDVLGYWAADGWMRRLSNAAAWFYGVQVVWTKQGNYTSIHVVGRESCRAAYVAMLPYLHIRVKRLASDGYYKNRYQSISRGRTAIGNALTHRLLILAAEKEDADTKLHGKQAKGVNALVPLDDLQIELREQFPEAREAQSRAHTTRLSLVAIADAATVDLNAQIKRTDEMLALNKGVNP